jgi:glycosyltransferase involved in cell wall biosynthesis
MMSKPRILLFADWFEPGYKAGGPIRSCVHFVHQMQDRYSIYVFTSDRDLNDTAPYAGIVADKWLDYNSNVKVLYGSPAQLSWKSIRSQVNNIRPDFIYLNSMFSKYFTIYPLLMSRFGGINSKIVLSPRGMLRESALKFKPVKKKFYLQLFRQLGLHKRVHFHATDKTEESDIQKHFGAKVQLSLVSNYPGMLKDYPGSIEKKDNELSIIFVGRLHPVKGLDYLLERIGSVKGKISLTVVGNAEDEAYTNQCKNITSGYAENIKVRFTGEIPNDKLPAIIAQHHIFALPTKGENFGHAIFESLSSGRPVVISDQTPWRNLSEKMAGWDISLQQPEMFTAVLQSVVSFNQAEYDKWSYKSWQFAKIFVEKDDLKKIYSDLFS